ncbi:hypothetical protein FHETE_3688 [Fusarium heterosporum]|uniref:Fe2OG dioxygenase domain-containing protein n=1 Tax=Fusarium heterosporum TaxID=42747 RepID=A0A8H5TP03_FUSHE|nr:hypothetical protein FHETE_3688 [Fusarium heterosporum]
MESTTTATQTEGDPSSVDILLSAVSSALEKRAGKDIFAIGGSVQNEDGPLKVTIRWDDEAKGFGRNLNLPIAGDKAAQDSLNTLVDNCQPATFGFKNEEVLDEEYRKAGKMETDRFCSNFSPYEHGIIDTINQVFAQGSHYDDRGLGIKAELYKLNVYSAPSGKFKPHVDTPRSDRQIGSLVVCLPVEHNGGELAVRHGGREIVFDWAPRSTDTVQWAAFFSDCEHEVLQVTEGHRLTLTYNLFWTSYGPASMSDHLQALDQESLPFFAALEKLLANKEFLQKGGLIGFNCTHAYPHTSRSSVDNLHHMLKGLDMVVYQALKRILGTAQVAAVVDDSQFRCDLEQEISLADNPAKLEELSPADRDALKGKPAISTTLKPTFTSWYDYNEVNYLDPATIVDDEYGESTPVYPRRSITWLEASPGSRTLTEFAVAYAAYGNEMVANAYYTSAVIVAEVHRPSSEDGGTDSEEGSVNSDVDEGEKEDKAWSAVPEDE